MLDSVYMKLQLDDISFIEIMLFRNHLFLLSVGAICPDYELGTSDEFYLTFSVVKRN